MLTNECHFCGQTFQGQGEDCGGCRLDDEQVQIYLEDTMGWYGDDYDDDHSDFADPGGRSALRAASRDNPRNRPCPNCKAKNRLTPRDVELGYQCDACADRAEGGGYGRGDY